MVTTPVHRGIDVENLGTVSMRFRSGATGLLEASTALYPGSAERLELHGTRGTMVLEGGNIVRWEILNAGPNDEPGDTNEETGTGASDPMAFPHIWHRAQIADFIDAVRERRPPAVDGGQARCLHELCDAVYRSADEGRMVDLKF